MSLKYNYMDHVISQCGKCEICDPDNCPKIKRKLMVMIFTKRILDIIISIGGVVVFGLVYLIVAIPIKMDGGPVLFRQKRVGKDGVLFDIYKFRTMHIDAERKLEKLLASDSEVAREYYQNFKLKADPRLTLFGKFLRKTSLDELPQFINILKGEMSVIGPRPVLKQEVDMYYTGVRAKKIFKVRPGLSGLWQVSGRSDVEDYRKRVNMDCHYIENWSLWLDFKILFKTIGQVLLTRGAY